MRRLEALDLETVRPNWLTTGAIRLGLLSLFVVLTAMVRPRLTHWSAGWLLLAGAGFVVAAAALFSLATRRVALALPFLDAPWRLTDAVLLVLRRVGLPLLGLAFFLVWTFVYAFISPPGDIVAHSRGARAATMIEMLTAFALVTAYAGSFLELRGGPLRADEPPVGPDGPRGSDAPA